MSQENVEIAQRLFEEFNRTFTEGTGDLYALIDPDVEWIPINAMLEGTTYQGHEGVRQWIEDVKRDWAEFEARPEHFLDLGDDGVLALGSWRARGRGGDVLLDIPQAAWLGQYPGGKDRPDADLHRAKEGPRSRRAVGVGDVGAERRGRLRHAPSHLLPTPERSRDPELHLRGVPARDGTSCNKPVAGLKHPKRNLRGRRSLWRTAREERDEEDADEGAKCRNSDVGGSGGGGPRRVLG